jgi:hypothetical protein
MLSPSSVFGGGLFYLRAYRKAREERMDKKPNISSLRSTVRTLGLLFFCCLIATQSQGATGEVMVTSPVVDDTNMIAVPWISFLSLFPAPIS